MSETPYPPPPPENEYVQSYEAPSTGMATTALVLGIISIPTTCVCVGPLLGLVAIILGIVTMVRVGSQPERFSGKGKALGGILTGALSFVLAIVVFSMFGALMGKVMGVADTGINLTNIGIALQSYDSTHDQYPPDLETLVEKGLIPANPLAGADDDPTSGVYYVVGVDATDPPHWIVAYEYTSVMGIKMVGVLHVGSPNPEMLEAPKFEQALETFKQEYEEVYGEPPTILEPADAP